MQQGFFQLRDTQPCDKWLLTDRPAQLYSRLGEICLIDTPCPEHFLVFRLIQIRTRLVETTGLAYRIVKRQVLKGMQGIMVNEHLDGTLVGKQVGRMVQNLPHKELGVPHGKSAIGPQQFTTMVRSLTKGTRHAGLTHGWSCLSWLGEKQLSC